MEIILPKKWIKMFSIAILGFFLSANIFAQTGGNIDVKGHVKDALGPVTGVSVVVKGTQKGTITNLDGEFSLKAPANSKIVVSFIGYKTQELPVSSEMNITLAEDNELLDEVIVIGYATGSKRTVSGTIDRVGKKDMNVGVVSSPLDALKGKVAGVNISRVGGDPSSDASIRVRGTTSLTGGNDPLVIIDGVFGDLKMLNSLSPNDIESFTILKDASETAQYGSRGASGVIVVGTQKGKFGTKSLSYEGTFGIESVYKNIKMLSGEQYRQALKDHNINGLDKGHNTDFFKEMQRTGYTQNHRVSFGGGSEDANYRASIGVIDREGIIRNNKSTTYTSKIDLSQYFFDKKFLIESGIFASKNDRQYVNDYHKTFYSAAGMNPTFSNQPEADGSWIEDPNANEIDNPLGRLTISDKENSAYVTAHARLSYNILEGLKASAFGSYTYNEKENATYIPNNIRNGKREGRGKASRSENKTETLLGNFTLNYKKEFGEHFIDALGLIEGQEYKYHGFNAQARGFDTNILETNNLGAGALVKYGDVGSYKNNYKLFSYMARVNYMYANKYIVTGNVRADGSSKMGANHKWGYFPSISGAWVMSEENFIKENAKFIDQLKLRVSYGVTGNQDAIEVQNSLRLFEPKDPTFYNNNQHVIYQYNRNENPDLKWESKRTFNVGFDALLFNDKVSLTMDYYRSKTVDLLYNYDVPNPPFVHPTLLANMGEMENNGLEITIRYTPIRTKDMELSISPNFSYQTNKLTSLAGTYKGQPMNPKEYWSLGGVSGAGMIGGNTNATFNFIGEPIGTFYLPKSDGLVRQKDGSYKYHIVNLDNDPNIDINNGKDRYIAGQAMPKFNLGTNLSFRYKAFDIQAQLTGAFGHKIYNGTSLSYMSMTGFPTYNVMAEAPDVNIRDLTVTDYWLEKGDYLHIEYISVGYNINTEKFNKWVKNMRVTASVNNLYTFTNYTGLSPMINTTVMNDNLGIDDKRFYPLSRTYSIGLNVTF